MPHRPEFSFPPGTELVFGPEASRRQYVNDRLAGAMRGWGFDELVLPALDYPETFWGDEATQYEVHDKEGRRLTLRSDFTGMAVKALAIELKRQKREIRASYEGRVYRHEVSGHGRRIEQTQRGLEWVGVSGPVFDAATVLIVRECLAAAGVQGAVIVIGHAGYVQALVGAGGRIEPNMVEAIDHKNPSRIRELAARYGLAADRTRVLSELPLLTGGPEVIDRARKLEQAGDGAASAALSELESLADLLRESDVKEGILFDLGEVRSFNYYSGFMFKIYHPEVGEDLGGGGRYDRLFDHYQMQVPSVGFSLNIGRVADATVQDDYAVTSVASVAASGGAAALRKIAMLRATGASARLDGGA